jgi:hypothetical protein
VDGISGPTKTPFCLSAVQKPAISLLRIVGHQIFGIEDKCGRSVFRGDLQPGEAIAHVLSVPDLESPFVDPKIFCFLLVVECERLHGSRVRGPRSIGDKVQAKAGVGIDDRTWMAIRNSYG